MNVTDLYAERERRLRRAHEDWKAALALAHETQRFDHCIQAGRAWRRFLDLFMSEEQRDYVGRADAAEQGVVRELPRRPA